jgi:hypothetical protein
MGLSSDVTAFKNRVDGRNLEPGSRLHEDQSRLQALLRGKVPERFRGVKGLPFEQGFDLRLVPKKLG